MHEKISRLIKLTGISQNKLAEAVGIRAASFSDLKNGNWNPSAVQALKIARALGVSVDFLLDEGRDDFPSRSILDRERWVLDTVRALGFDEAKRRLLRVGGEEGPADVQRGGEVVGENARPSAPKKLRRPGGGA